MATKPKISVMVTALGKVDDRGTVRQSLHMFTFDSEEQLDEWLAMSPVQQEVFDGGPDVHVELPRTNTRRKE